VDTLEDLERLRRSLAMLSPGQPAGFSREEAMRLLAGLQRARRGFERLEVWRQRLADARAQTAKDRATRAADTASPPPEAEDEYRAPFRLYRPTTPRQPTTPIASKKMRAGKRAGKGRKGRWQPA